MANIKQEMINGVFWTAIQKYSGIILQLGITALLARLLTPEEFGVVAVAQVLIVFFNIFTDMGLTSGIIQKDLNKEEISHIFSFTVYFGGFISTLFFFSAWPIANYYGNKDLVGICQLLAIPMFVGTIGMVPATLVAKNKRFKFITQRTLVFQLISGILAVCIAFLGYGYFALILPGIITSIGTCIVDYKQYPQKFYFRIDFSPIKKIFSYSIYLFSFNIFNYFTRNLDKLIIGKYFSLNDLGYYQKSYSLMMLPLQQITHVVTPVMHPVLAQLQNDSVSLGRTYVKIIKLLATIGFPLGVFLYFSADSLINIVFGEQWQQAVPVFQILALSVPTQIVMSSTGGIFQASGRTDCFFYAGMFHSLMTIFGFIIAANYFQTIDSMAWSLVITMNTQLMIALGVIYIIVLKQPFMPVVKTFFNPILSAFLLIFFMQIFDMFRTSPIIDLLVQLIIVTFVTCSFIQMSKQYDLRPFFYQIVGRIKILLHF